MDRKERTRIRRMIDSSMLTRKTLWHKFRKARGSRRERFARQEDRLVAFERRCWEAIQRGKGHAVPPIVED